MMWRGAFPRHDGLEVTLHHGDEAELGSFYLMGRGGQVSHENTTGDDCMTMSVFKTSMVSTPVNRRGDALDDQGPQYRQGHISGLMLGHVGFIFPRERQIGDQDT